MINLLETVLDYQMNTKAIVRALHHFRDHQWDDVRAMDDLNILFTRFADDEPGTNDAPYMWGYSMWYSPLGQPSRVPTLSHSTLTLDRLKASNRSHSML